jgi:hypothetical protein
VQDLLEVIRWGKAGDFKEMAARLRKERVSAFPVVDDDGTVVGVVSETDLLPKETLDAGWTAGAPEMTSRVLNQGNQEEAESVTAAELMTQPAVKAAHRNSSLRLNCQTRVCRRALGAVTAGRPAPPGLSALITAPPPPHTERAPRG